MTDIERAKISAVWEFESEEDLRAFLDGAFDALVEQLEKGLPVVLSLDGDSYKIELVEPFDG